MERLVPVLERLSVPFEIVLVDDGSRDGSWNCIEALCRDYPGLTGMRLSRNYGQHNALLAGIRAAKGSVVVTMDDDLQHPPEEIPRLLAALREGYDVVYGTPVRRQHRRWRNVVSWVGRASLRGSVGAGIAHTVGPFRAFDTAVREGFAHFNGPFVSLDVLLSWSTARFGSVPVEHVARTGKRSNYTLGRLMHHYLNLLTGFSAWPLRAAAGIGLVSALIGLLVLVLLALHVLRGGDGGGGLSAAVAVLVVLAGVQLLAIGLSGEYLARLYVMLAGKPSYVVRDRVGSHEACDNRAISSAEERGPNQKVKGE